MYIVYIIWNIIFSADLRGKMVQCFHKACDNKQNMLTENNLEFLGKTADAITATLNELSETSGIASGISSCVYIYFTSAV